MENVKKRKLNYRFHNPNSANITADYLLDILMEVNAEKIKIAIKESANHIRDEDKNIKIAPT